MFYPFDPTPNVRKSQDDRVSSTLAELLDNTYFAQPENVLVYTCDSSDGRAKYRQKLFDKWHASVQHLFDRHEIEVGVEMDDDTTETLYGGIVVRKTFPHPDILKTELIDKASGIILEKYGY